MGTTWTVNTPCTPSSLYWEQSDIPRGSDPPTPLSVGLFNVPHTSHDVYFHFIGPSCLPFQSSRVSPSTFGGYLESHFVVGGYPESYFVVRHTEDSWSQRNNHGIPSLINTSTLSVYFSTGVSRRYLTWKFALNGTPF